MAAVIKHLYKGYFWIFEDLTDPRSNGYPLMGSPLYPFAICTIYLYLILKILPNFMKTRPAYNLDRVIIGFNFIQVLVNIYICYHAVKETLKISWICAPVDFTPTEHNLFITQTCYIYFLTKAADLLDTIFFILRKKEKQVSFLHVYHHFGMIFIGWAGVQFLGGGHSIFIGAANSFVHVVMYFYYFLTIWKPEYKKNIWWKKHITQLQLAQFAFFVVMFGEILIQPNCQYPKLVPLFILPQNFFMICLFGDFYWKAYVRPKNKNE